MKKGDKVVCLGINTIPFEERIPVGTLGTVMEEVIPNDQDVLVVWATRLDYLYYCRRGEVLEASYADTWFIKYLVAKGI